MAYPFAPFEPHTTAAEGARVNGARVNGTRANGNGRHPAGVRLDEDQAAESTVCARMWSRGWPERWPTRCSAPGACSRG